MRHIITLVCIAGLACLGIAGGQVSAQDDTIKIGAIFSVTGPAAWLGGPEKNTAEMFVKAMNEKGGVNGKKLVVIVEDDQGDNTKAVAAAEKLITKDKVIAIIGPSRSDTSMAAKAKCNAYKIPMISCAAARTIVEPATENLWIFKTPQRDDDAVRRIYDDMKEKGFKKVALITATEGFGKGGRDELKKLAPEYGFAIVADETYTPTDVDMTPQLTKIKGTDAQALVNWSIVPGQSIVMRNAKALGMKIQIYQSHGFGNVKYAEAAGDAAEGVLFPAGRLLIANDLPDSHLQKKVLMGYKTMYESSFPGENVSTFGGHAYDALWLIVNAVKKVGTDAAKVREELERSEFIGTGGHFKMSKEDHTGLNKTAFEMLTVKTGKFAPAYPERLQAQVGPSKESGAQGSKEKGPAAK